MTSFTQRFDDPGGDGPRLAVKCSIDVAGAVTSAGSPILADAPPADRDAPIVTFARVAGARVVGHTVMPEFGLTATGINPLMGTPLNPLDAGRLPGGSSTGSTVAVVTGEADTAYGTDAGGSLRIPPACCGAVGMKTTQGRVPTGGVRLLTPTIDVVGPIGADLAGCVLGMTLLEPGFAPAPQRRWRVARLRPADVEPSIDAAIDALLDAADDVDIVEADLSGIHDAYRAAAFVLLAEAWITTGPLLAQRERMSEDIANKLEWSQHVSGEQLADAGRVRVEFRGALEALLADVDAIALPTLPVNVPPADAGLEADVDLSRLTLPFNLSGHPALALPAPRTDGELPASLQLVGRWWSEEQLFAIAGAL